MMLMCKHGELSLASPVVMGILNVTPDSFSDGGSFNRVDSAVKHALEMESQGAKIIDIGGESTRPGAAEVSVEEELARVIPVIEALRKQSDLLISVDTSKPEVMRAAVAAGADIINDIRSLTEPGAIETIAELQVPVCLMHMQGSPQTMQDKPQYQDLFQEVTDFFAERIEACQSAGIARELLMLDPGFGFGKTVAQNYELLNQLERFNEFQLPLLVGMSRKSMIGHLLELPPSERLIGSVVCAALAAAKGAHIIRVHDVKETVEALKVVEAFREPSLIAG